VKLTPSLISEVTGIKDVEPSAVERAGQFCALLFEANKKINLISRGGDQEREVTRQFLISLSSLPLIPQGKSARWLDIGSGGGFPSIPLALFRPRIEFVLVESVAKKAYFLERTAEDLALDNVTVINERIRPGTKLANCAGEDCYNWLSVKAVTSWEETLQWGAAFLGHKGRLLTYKADTPTTDETMAIADNGFELIHTIDISQFFQNTNLRIFLLQFAGNDK
jgi:16S rRNA (guanine(527)-N(7))-methyltransferase RsmG